MNLKNNNLNKSKTKENELTKASLNLNSKFQILTSDAKGITLIALVITVIVMLILVAVTIQVATNGNLFKHAGNAVKQTKNAVYNENYLSDGKVQVGGEEFDIDAYVASKIGEESGGSGGGAVYDGTDLTGTTWYLNENFPDANTSFTTSGYNLQITSNNESFNYIVFCDGPAASISYKVALGSAPEMWGLMSRWLVK